MNAINYLCFISSMSNLLQSCGQNFLTWLIYPPSCVESFSATNTSLRRTIPAPRPLPMTPVQVRTKECSVDSPRLPRLPRPLKTAAIPPKTRQCDSQKSPSNASSKSIGAALDQFFYWAALTFTASPLSLTQPSPSLMSRIPQTLHRKWESHGSHLCQSNDD